MDRGLSVIPEPAGGWLHSAHKEKACAPADGELAADVRVEKMKRHLETAGHIRCQWTNEKGTRFLHFYHDIT